MTDDELTAINNLEMVVSWFKEFEDEVREFRQGLEADLFTIKMRREIEARKAVPS